MAVATEKEAPRGPAVTQQTVQVYGQCLIHYWVSNSGSKCTSIRCGLFVGVVKCVVEGLGA